MTIPQSITEKTGLPFSLVITISGLVLGVGANYATAKADIGYVQQQLMDTKAEVKALNEKQQTLEIKQQRADDQYARILDSLGELKGEVRSLSNRPATTVPVRAH